MRGGARTPPDVLADGLCSDTQIQWSHDGKWIAFSGVNGLSVVSPDGKSTRVIQEEHWMGFAWSEDSQRLYGIRQSADLMPLPVALQPVRGLTRVSPTTFLASIARVHSDVWLLDGFDIGPGLRDRLTAMFFRRRGSF